MLRNNMLEDNNMQSMNNNMRNMRVSTVEKATDLHLDSILQVVSNIVDVPPGIFLIL